MNALTGSGATRKKLVGSGWKMQKTLAEATDYIVQLREALHESPRVQVFIAAPFTHLWKLRELTRGTSILLGAQNMHWADEGPYTGEVSPTMLAEIGLDLVELAHSERRSYFNETDYTVNKKVKACLAHGMIPLLCVGEAMVDREYGVVREVIGRQVKIALHGVDGRDAGRIWIAYEPVWAIGEGGIPAEPEVAAQVHALIRTSLAELFGEDQAREVRIIYGGSVNLGNAVPFIRQPNVDGIFIGRASWQAESFLEIIHAVEENSEPRA